MPFRIGINSSHPYLKLAILKTTIAPNDYDIVVELISKLLF